VRRAEARLGPWLAALSLAFTFQAAAAAEGTGLSLLPQRAAAPAITLDDLEGHRTDLAALRGRVVLVNFWATWCPPCRREMPSMERLRQTLAGEAFTVLAVNVGEAEDTVFAFTGQLEPAPAFTILLDRDSTALRAWPVKGLPTTFLVDREGRLAARAVGGREFDDPGIVQAIRRLLAEDVAETPAPRPVQQVEAP
jgi:thiol-disulfide isomerase/thioredoxin